jgi:AbrB family looped-hinge helix DNA binding protein
MPTAKLTSKGQITIPLEVRKALGLRTGDRLAFVVRDDGSWSLDTEKVDLRSLAGKLRPKVKGVTIEMMNEAIARGWGRRGRG